MTAVSLHFVQEKPFSFLMVVFSLLYFFNSELPQKYLIYRCFLFIYIFFIEFRITFISIATAITIATYMKQS